MSDEILFWWAVQDLALLALITFPVWGYGLAVLWVWLEGEKP